MLFNTTKQELYTPPDDAQLLSNKLPEPAADEVADLVPDNMRVLVERVEREQHDDLDDDLLAQPVPARPKGPKGPGM